MVLLDLITVFFVIEVFIVILVIVLVTIFIIVIQEPLDLLLLALVDSRLLAILLNDFIFSLFLLLKLAFFLSIDDTSFFAILVHWLQLIHLVPFCDSTAAHGERWLLLGDRERWLVLILVIVVVKWIVVVGHLIIVVGQTKVVIIILLLFSTRYEVVNILITKETRTSV